MTKALSVIDHTEEMNKKKRKWKEDVRAAFTEERHIVFACATANQVSGKDR